MLKKLFTQKWFHERKKLQRVLLFRSFFFLVFCSKIIKLHTLQGMVGKKTYRHIFHFKDIFFLPFFSNSKKVKWVYIICKLFTCVEYGKNIYMKASRYKWQILNKIHYFYYKWCRDLPTSWCLQCLLSVSMHFNCTYHYEAIDR